MSTENELKTSSTQLRIKRKSHIMIGKGVKMQFSQDPYAQPRDTQMGGISQP